MRDLSLVCSAQVVCTRQSWHAGTERTLWRWVAVRAACRMTVCRAGADAPTTTAGRPPLTGGPDQIQSASARPPPELTDEEQRRAQEVCAQQGGCPVLPEP